MIESITVECVSATHIGLRRTSNQDNHLVRLASDEMEWHTVGHLVVVADGVGGNLAGEKASAMAVELVPRLFRDHVHRGAAVALQEAFAATNTAIHETAETEPAFQGQGMGTSCTTLVLRPEGAWIGHVGQSRLYRVRDGRIELLALDAYEEMVRSHARALGITPDEASRCCISYNLPMFGLEPTVTVHVKGPEEVREGDVFLLSSAGLQEVVSDPEIGAVVTALPVAEACPFLVDLTNLRGGPKNTTVAIVRVERIVPAPEPENREPDIRTRTIFRGVSTALTHVANWVRRRNQTPASVPVRIHHQESCVIGRPLVERLIQASAKLAAWIEPRNWDLDWPYYRRHRELGDTLLARDDLEGAFREHSRALRVLTAALDRFRDADCWQPNVWPMNPERKGRR
jgi:serine/threonine protein phosphatase PrpC